VVRYYRRVDQLTDALANLDSSTLLIGVLALGVLAFLGRITRRKKPQKPRGGRSLPRVGDYWMADVPFRDGSGSKDRPCLVVGLTGTAFTVLYVTSRDRSQHGAFLPVDSSGWGGKVANKQSWMQIGSLSGEDPRLTVTDASFRRWLGRWNEQEEQRVRAALQELALGNLPTDQWERNSPNKRSSE